MGTRAAFWVGDPREMALREWLGCLAWDGYPDGVPEPLRQVTTEDEYRHCIQRIAQAHEFAPPGGGWPYPWADNIFLTDYTYAWMGGQVMVSHFCRGFFPMARYFDGVGSPGDPDMHDATLVNIPAPEPYNPSQPDSILIVRLRVPGERRS